MSQPDTDDNSQSKAPGVWRKVVLFPLTRLVIALLFLWAGYIFHLIASAQLPGDAVVLREFSLVLFLIGGYFAYVRLIERRAVREFAPNKALKELGIGIAIGGGLVTAIVGILWVFGLWEVVALNPWSVVAVPIVTVAATAIWEEMVFRGIVFRMLEEGLGTWIALILSALVFGLLHMGNENASIIGILTIALTGGLLLAGVYILTRRLWLAIGIHYAVNVFQGPIFGLPVSGGEKTGLLESSLRGPELLTGGTFGIEASLIMAVFAFAMVFYVLKMAYRKGKFVNPLWKSMRSLTDGGILPDLKKE